MLQLVFGRGCLYRLTQVWTITTLPLAATFVPPGVVWADERKLLHDGLSWCGRGPPWWLPTRLPACGYCHDAFVAGIWNHYNLSALEPHFMTCSFSALHSPRGRMSEVELAMLRSRLKLYVFQRRLPQIRDIRPCPNCFAMFVLSAGRDVSKFVDQGFPRVAQAAVSN